MRRSEAPNPEGAWGPLATKNERQAAAGIELP